MIGPGSGRRGVAILAALGALAVAGCSSSASTPSHTPAAPPAAVVPAAAHPGEVATRWWSNTAEVAGSRIDPADPGAGAAKLHPSRSDYCGMLRQTLAAGHSILPGATATDPALRAAATAFVSELQGVAPGEVRASWQTLGTVLMTLVRPGGSASALKGLDASKIRSAVTSVSADAKSRCGVDLSATAG